MQVGVVPNQDESFQRRSLDVLSVVTIISSDWPNLAYQGCLLMLRR
jgi:hypothetical protein